MRLGEIGASGYGDQINRLKKRVDGKKDLSKKSDKKITRTDSYTPSSEVGKAKNLDEVKKRVKAGFYSSELVTNDLTDVISKLFNQSA